MTPDAHVDRLMGKLVRAIEVFAQATEARATRWGKS
jgi:hypothetical protein